jgi:hypothetical protein
MGKHDFFSSSTDAFYLLIPWSPLVFRNPQCASAEVRGSEEHIAETGGRQSFAAD